MKFDSDYKVYPENSELNNMINNNNYLNNMNNNNKDMPVQNIFEENNNVTMNYMSANNNIGANNNI